MVLAHDSNVQEQIVCHQGRVVRVVLSDFNMAFDIVPNEQGILLMQAQLVDADVTLTGTSSAMFSMLKQSTHKGKSRFKHLTLEGDFELALALSRAFSQLRVDWEVLLAKPIGRAAAHDVVRLGAKIKGLGDDLASKLGISFTRSLQTGLEVCPHQQAVDDFCQEVDTLKLAVDRLEARIARVKQSGED